MVHRFHQALKRAPKAQKILHFLFLEIWYNCYNVHQQKHTLCYNYNNIVTYTNSYTFQASMAHHQGVYSCTKQSSDLTIISNLWNCGKFINVWCTESDMYTVIGAVQWTHSNIQAAPITMHISVSINQTPKKFLVNKTNRWTEFQFYWYYESTCFGQPFCPSSGVLSGTTALVHFMQLCSRYRLFQLLCTYLSL